jgi:hypothetical protein
MKTEDALARLSLSSLRLHPDDLHAVVRELAVTIGLDDLRIHVVDLEQRQLVPLPVPDAEATEALAVDDSEAGRAYRLERPVIEDGTSILWLPLLDSAERFGVVRATIAPGTPAPEQLEHWTAFVSLVGEILANKQDHGDLIATTRRTSVMSVAAEMRWAMLPPLTFTGRNLAVSGVVLPAYEVAGDTFDYAVNGHLASLVIIDAVGHGLEAARIANLAVGAYRQGRRRGAGTIETYRSMDALVAAEFGDEKFATAQLATLDLRDGRLSWLNAGHPPPMVIRDGRRIDLQGDVCLPVGLAAQQAVASAATVVAEEALAPGDVVLFFTDGITEARSADGAEFGRDRLADLAEQTMASGGPASETVRLLSHAVLAHQAGVLQDDATLLLLSWTGPMPAGVGTPATP